MLFGHTTTNPPSRFLDEIPEENSQWKGKQSEMQQPMRTERPAAVDYGFSGFSGFSGYAGTAPRGGASYGARQPAAKAAPSARPLPRSAGAAPAARGGKLSLNQGDRVVHKAFGHGRVIRVQPMGGDALVEINFEETGNKRLMLNSAGAYLQRED